MVRMNLLRFANLALLVACVTNPAQGGWVAGFTGNSQTLYSGVGVPATTPGATSDGLINFAVWNNTGSDWESDLGVDANRMDLVTAGGTSGQDIGSLKGNAPYIYFYQMVNTDPSGSFEDDIDQLGIDRGLFTEGGYLTIGGTLAVFNEDDGGAGAATGPLANPAIGTATTDTFPGNGVPGSKDPPGPVLAGTPFVADPGAAAKAPNRWSLLSQFYEFGFATTLPPNGYSAVIYMTSDLPPSYQLGYTADGAPSVFGDIPSNVPELGTFAMSFGALAMGLVVAFGTSPRKRDE